MTAEWCKLDRRTVAVTALTTAGVAVAAGVPTGVGLAKGTGPWAALALVLGGALLLTVGAAAVDDLRWRRTSYRVGAERVELRSGILVRNRRSLARERIRSVDLTANPLLRIFGLTNVKIGTGESTGAGEGSLMLHPVTREEGERLRTELLHRAPAGGDDDAGSAGGGDGVVAGELARLDPSWVRFAPMSFLTPTIGVAAFGVVLQVAEWFGLQEGVISWALDLLRGLPLLLALLSVVVTGIVVGVLGSLAVFVEMWWQFRLEREPNGTLRVRRGLLTTRSVSLEERRLRGVELVEPLGNRLLGGARLDAVATGLVRPKEGSRTDHKTLLPPAPRADADRVAAAVLREPVAPTASVRLTGHPPAARARRLRWAVLAALVPPAVLAVLGALLTDVLLHLAWITALVLLPVAVLLALEAYRNLGHGLTGGYLVTRHGSVRRTTVALQRRGVIGWTATQSIFQRRAGLLTLTATTAAGAGAYSIYDVGQEQGLAFAEEAVPDLFGPFLDRT
ncbi:putative membrane protein [Amycolatopsis arida]|uniref:Putative membrane protein n=1 Tax=Amycolatopsis arida TaxID=587909 RepID=A0A1I5VCD6_9PSEU|nr:PH domain-containing protein [Amycolatopsis arida]TDX91230.1 putative membrane protein [Amycolatopsis arida]SFQ05218.1 putative membrane protein [Amycolatopsis arida]